ncbi:unnamed protein product [Caenorhabditis bovis]|uniref:Serpentine Receptor, class H n=1 Tax=Caenorhabditis bovis TaxID=2654633 RepID=A0A8S1EAY5_9PELO|nr:unnamed protein product [Caenorhabditis bovis]
MTPILTTVLPDQTQEKLNALKIVPCPTQEFFSSRTILPPADNSIFYALMFLIGIIIIASEVLFFSIHCFLYLFNENTNLSKATRSLQKKFLIAITIQMAGPFVVCVLPILYEVFSIMISYYNQVLNNMVYVIIAHHGFLNTILMVILFAPYREYTKSLICMKKEKSTTVSVHITETNHA